MTARGVFRHGIVRYWKMRIDLSTMTISTRLR